MAVLGGNRIPFARSDGAYANASNQDMFTAALDGLVDRFHLAGERLDMVIGGAVLKHSRDFNLMRECVLGSALSPYTPAFDLQQACGTGLQAAIAAADGIAAGRYEVGRRGRGGHHLRRADRLRRRPAPHPARAAPVEVQRRAAQAGRQAARHRSGVEIPTNGEPRTGLSMGEHAAITAKQMGIKRVDQDELAAASHRNMAAAYDRGFFDDLVTPFLGLYRDDNLRPDSSPEKLATLKPVFGVKNGDATMTAGNSTPLTDGASVALLATEEWATAHDIPVLAYFVDGETAAVDYVNGADGLLMAPTYAVPRLLARNGLTLAGLRLLRDPRGLRVRGAGHPAGVGVRGVLQGAAGSGRRAGAHRPVQAQRQRLVAGGRAPVRGDRWPHRRAARQTVGAEEGRDGPAGARPDLGVRRRRPGCDGDSRSLRTRTVCNARRRVFDVPDSPVLPSDPPTRRQHGASSLSVSY